MSCTALETVLETERAAHTKTATERDRLAELNAKLEAIIAEIRRAHLYGERSG